MAYEGGKELMPGNFGDDPKTSRNPVYFNNGQIERSKIKPIPAGLKMVAGMNDPPAHLGQLNGWRCGDSQPTKAIPSCTDIEPDSGRNRLELRIAFPQCVKLDSNGNPVLDSSDHKSHVAYTTDNNQCPSTHPYPMPRIVEAFRFPSDGQVGDDVSISSDHGATPGSTLHADFWNTWNQPAMEELVRLCINQSGNADGPPCRDADPIAANPNYPNPQGGSAPPSAACADGLDNDGDTKVDLNDPGCTSSSDTDETDTILAGCDSTSTSMSGSINATGTEGGHSLPSGDLRLTGSGTLRGCLSGSSSADFDLFLKKVNSDGSTSELARSATNGTSTENITYSASAGTYRWRVLAADGPGDYTLRQQTPGSAPPPAACGDGMDNDGDTKVDYPADPGCSSSADSDEKDPPAKCADTIDNDLDGLIDMSDPGCSSPSDNDETNSVPQPLCEGDLVFTSTLASQAESPSASYNQTASSAIHHGCLSAGSGLDFDLYLQKYVRTCTAILICSTSWSDLTSSLTRGTSSERITYTGTPGTYRYLIKSYSGSGSARLAYRRG